VVSRPFAGTHGVDGIFYAEGQRFDDGTAPYVNYEGVDAAYFSTLGVPILRGRAIESTDRAKTERVVVVNESFARMFWPGENPIGRRVGMEDEREKGKWRTVVGLAADTRYREFQSPRPSIYVPYEQGIPVAPTFIAIRTMDSRWAALAVRQVLDEVEPRAAVLDVTPLMSLLAQPLARPRFQFALAGSFAGLALFLAVVGTSAVLAFLVRQRRREIGVRMALGAQARDIRALVVGQALSIGALGIALGIGLSAAASRLVQPVLFDVSATDPRVLAGTAAVLVLAIGITTFLPMRAATQVDPAIALRSE
jgi:hypothetical protein